MRCIESTIAISGLSEFTYPITGFVKAVIFSSVLVNVAVLYSLASYAMKNYIPLLVAAAAIVVAAVAGDMMRTRRIIFDEKYAETTK